MWVTALCSRALTLGDWVDSGDLLTWGSGLATGHGSRPVARPTLVSSLLTRRMVHFQITALSRLGSLISLERASVGGRVVFVCAHGLRIAGWHLLHLVPIALA